MQADQKAKSHARSIAGEAPVVTLVVDTHAILGLHAQGTNLKLPLYVNDPIPTFPAESVASTDSARRLS